jgi:hypothetical protein
MTRLDRSLFQKLPLRLVLVVPFVVQIFGAVGWLSYTILVL